MLERRAAVVCLSFLGLLALQACLYAQVPPPRTGLAAGISQIQARDFVNALVTLNDVVAEQTNRPEQAATLATAHAYRAVAFIGLDQPEWARGAALDALKADPRIVVTSAAFGARVAALFESARSPARDPEAAAKAAEAAGRFQDAFLGYLSALQSLPEPPPAAADQRLRERIIAVVEKLEPKPSVPEEARTRLARAEALLGQESAASEMATAQATAELRKAVRLAPWWPEAMVKLATTLQRSGRFDEALINLGLYELADPVGYRAISGPGSPTAVTRPAPVASPAAVAAPAPAADPNTAAVAVIYIYFPHAARAMGTKSKVLCDGTKVADLAHEHYIALNAAAGYHNVEFKGRNASGAFEAGRTHYIRVGIEGYPAHFALRIVEAEKAVAEIREKQVLPNEAQNNFSATCTSVAAVPAKKRF